jgi:DNA repair photolyase
MQRPLATRAGASPSRKAGRGATGNPPNRFERLHWVPEPDAPDSGPPATAHRSGPSRSALTRNQSPDLPFDVGLNPYRGCEHGCAYCYARPTHEYLGFSAGLDFETQIVVKEDLPRLLRAELAAPGWRPQVVGISGVTDAYQPLERRLELTRRCLEIFAAFRNPVGIITKNALVARDSDLLSQLAASQAVSVTLSLTTLDSTLHRSMEPRASHPSQRLRAIEALAEAGIPVGAMLGPVIPGLTDHEIPSLVAAAAGAGASFAGYLVLRLPHGVKELFATWLERHFPERKAKVLGRIRELRGGELDDTRFGTRMRGEGHFARQIADLFALSRRRAGLAASPPALSTLHFRNPDADQLSLFS